MAATGDNVAFLRLDERFHQLSPAAPTARRLGACSRASKAQLDRVRYLSLPEATPLDVIIGQHRRIVDGIAGRDPSRAEQAMREHLSEILVSLPKLAAEHPAYFAD